MWSVVVVVVMVFFQLETMKWTPDLGHVVLVPRNWTTVVRVWSYPAWMQTCRSTIQLTSVVERVNASAPENR